MQRNANVKLAKSFQDNGVNERRKKWPFLELPRSTFDTKKASK